MTHGGVKRSMGANGASFYMSSKSDDRPDIRKLFVDELGFKDVLGTKDIPTAQLASIAIQLKKSEKQLHVLADNTVYFSAMSKPGVKGAAMQMNDGTMVLLVNPSYHTSVSGSKKVLRSEQQSGFKTKTDGKITNDFSYTVRHEYGHITQFSIMRKTGKTDARIRSEVQSIATKKYGASGANPSGYGSKNAKEYFAESFASMTGGNPNAHGKALKDWIKQNT